MILEIEHGKVSIPRGAVKSAVRSVIFWLQSVFQFQEVQLKVLRHHAVELPSFFVSIPRGAVKRREKSGIEKRLKQVSIPRGAVKSC